MRVSEVGEGEVPPDADDNDFDQLKENYNDIPSDYLNVVTEKSENNETSDKKGMSKQFFSNRPKPLIYDSMRSLKLELLENSPELD